MDRTKKMGRSQNAMGEDHEEKCNNNKENNTQSTLNEVINNERQIKNIEDLSERRSEDAEQNRVEGHGRNNWPPEDGIEPSKSKYIYEMNRGKMVHDRSTVATPTLPHINPNPTVPPSSTRSTDMHQPGRAPQRAKPVMPEQPRIEDGEQLIRLPTKADLPPGQMTITASRTRTDSRTVAHTQAVETPHMETH